MAFTFTGGTEVSLDLTMHADGFQIIFKLYIYFYIYIYLYDLFLDQICYVGFNVSVWFCVYSVLIAINVVFTYSSM